LDEVPFVVFEVPLQAMLEDDARRVLVVDDGLLQQQVHEEPDGTILKGPPQWLA
jgi:hypothetical protein